MSHARSISLQQKLLFLILGIGLGLGHEPLNLAFLYFLILPFIAWIVSIAPSKKIAFSIGSWIGFGHFSSSIFWILEPFFVVQGPIIWFAPIALFLMALGLSLFWGAAFFINIWVFTVGWQRVLGLACFWTLGEFLRSNIFTGFPWGHPIYVFMDLPFIQIVSIFGIHGSFLILLTIFFLPAINEKKVWQHAAFSLVLLALLSFYGIIRQAGEIKFHLSDTLVRLVQPNAEQHLKWRPDKRELFYGRLIGYTAAKTENVPDVVIWPETSVPFMFHENGPSLTNISIQAGSSTSVIVGAIRGTAGFNRNSLIYLDEKGGTSAIYDKHHLVPFGEYLPLLGAIESLGLSALAQIGQGYEPGEGPRVIPGGNVPDFLPLICYEAIFPQNGFDNGEGAEWLVHITNDAWFGKFSGPYQHLRQTRMRALEQGKPLARSANTGVSAMIDPFGRVSAAIPLGEQGYIDVKLPQALNRTIYSLTGEWLWLSLCFLMIFWIKFPNHFISFRP